MLIEVSLPKILCGEYVFKVQLIQRMKIGIEPETTCMARKGRLFLLNILGHSHEGNIH